MLTKEQIDEYLQSIPPIPQIVKSCMKALNEGDLVKAADIALDDKALMHYLQSIVNKPIFGFRSTIKDARQLFGVLGLQRAKQIIYSYSILLLAPANWEVFEFDTHKFQELQARLIFGWEKILESLGCKEKELYDAITIIPASLVVCEMLFRPIDESVKLLKERKNLSYEEILVKMTGVTLLEIAQQVAKEWDFSPKVLTLLENVQSTQCNEPLCEYLKLLLAYEFSLPVMIQSGLSELFNFQVSCDDYLVEKFYKLMDSE